MNREDILFIENEFMVETEDSYRPLTDSEKERVIESE